jgi:hypothetical protein
MASTRSYTNIITSSEVSLGLERLLIIPLDDAWDASSLPWWVPPKLVRINFSALPPAPGPGFPKDTPAITNWVDLGSVDDTTPVFKTSRKRFQLKAGIPRVIQYEAINDMTATFSVTLHSRDWTKFQYAMGNYMYKDTISGGSLGTHGTYDESTSQSTLFVRQTIGTSHIQFYQLLGVADFLDGAQVQHFMPKVTAAEDFEEMIRPDKEGQTPLSFTAYGVLNNSQLPYSITPADPCTEIVIAERIFFPPAVCV